MSNLSKYIGFPLFHYGDFRRLNISQLVGGVFVFRRLAIHQNVFPLDIIQRFFLLNLHNPAFAVVKETHHFPLEHCLRGAEIQSVKNAKSSHFHFSLCCFNCIITFYLVKSADTEISLRVTATLYVASAW